MKPEVMFRDWLYKVILCNLYQHLRLIMAWFG